MFVGLIVVPIIGNAAEHSSAVMMAMRNRMDLAVSIAIGSSAQVALLIAPVLVFVGLAVGQPMDLAFSTFEVMSVALAVAVATSVVRDAESDWLEGAFLLLVYGMLGVAFFYYLSESGVEMAQTPVASRFDFTSREPYLAPPPRQRQRVVKISAILFAPDDAAPPPALTEWLARQADVVLRVREIDELMAISLRGPPARGRLRRAHRRPRPWSGLRQAQARLVHGRRPGGDADADDRRGVRRGVRRRRRRSACATGSAMPS